MAEMEHGLNDLAGGKPFNPPEHINCRSKVIDKPIIEYHEKDIDDYQGKWINLYFASGGGSFQGQGEFDSKRLANEASTGSFKIWRSEPNKFIAKLDQNKLGRRACCRDIIRSIPMPIGNA